ncbi:MAG: hypothetical protein ACNA7W_18805 [Pseudomonadales bacterium]
MALREIVRVEVQLTYADGLQGHLTLDGLDLEKTKAVLTAREGWPDGWKHFHLEVECRRALGGFGRILSDCIETVIPVKSGKVGGA